MKHLQDKKNVITKCTFFIMIISMVNCSPPEDPIKCTTNNSNCTITNTYGAFPDRSLCRAARVVYPTTEEELISAVANATKTNTRMKVATRSSHSIPKLVCPEGNNGLLISTKYLNRTLDVNVSSMTMTVESGMTLRQLINDAAKAKLALPYAPYWWGLTIGGMMGTGMEQIKKELEALKFEMNVKVAAIEAKITMMEMAVAKPISEKANQAVLSEGISANKSEGSNANIEQEALKLHKLSVKENTTSSPSQEKKLTKESISIPELNRSNIIKTCNTPGVMDIKNKNDFILAYVLFNLACCWHTSIGGWMKTLTYGTYNKVNIYPGAPAYWVRALYEMGSILCIYPSESLKEISMLPKDVVWAIERYCQVLKHKNIYIRFFTASPEWDNEEERMLPASHVIRMATTTKHLQPEKSEVIESTPEDIIKMISFRRAKGYKEQFEHIQKIIEEKQNIWVYESQDHMIYSKAVAPTKEEDWHYLDILCDHIFEGLVSGTQKTREELCKQFWRYPKHKCECCCTEGDISPISLDPDEFPDEWFESHMEK